MQEEVLDELDLIASNVGRLSHGHHFADTIHDFVRARDDRRHYVFLGIELDPGTRTIRVVSIGHYAEPRA